MKFILATILLALGAAEDVSVSCNTADVATCFDNVMSIHGRVLDLVPGTMSAWDGIYSDTQLTLQFKYASIACSTGGGACFWQGATGKRVVFIKDNGGTSTLSRLVIKDGNAIDGGGLYVFNSFVDLILIAFIDNSAFMSGGDWNHGGAMYVNSGNILVNLHGCSFAGNDSQDWGPDVYNYNEWVVFYGCPEGEDKPFRPPPPVCPPPH